MGLFELFLHFFSLNPFFLLQMISNINHLVEQYDRNMTREYELSQKAAEYKKEMSEQGVLMKGLATNCRALKGGECTS